MKDAVNTRFGVVQRQSQQRSCSDNVACDKQIREESFPMAVKGPFNNDDAALKKMKEVDTSTDSLDEFVKEVVTLTSSCASRWSTSSVRASFRTTSA